MNLLQLSDQVYFTPRLHMELVKFKIFHQEQLFLAKA